MYQSINCIILTFENKVIHPFKMYHLIFLSSNDSNNFCH